MIIELFLVMLVPILIIAVALGLERIERQLDRPAARPAEVQDAAASNREDASGAAGEPATGYAAGS